MRLYNKSSSKYTNIYNKGESLYMKRLMYVILILFLILAGVILTGCSTDKNRIKVEDMVAYMNEKYDDQFEYSSSLGVSEGGEELKIIVKSKKYPEAEVLVSYYKLNGEWVYADNYVSYKYENQTKKTIQNMLEEIYNGDVNLQYGVGTSAYLNNFTKETTFEEYISAGDASIRFNAVVLINNPKSMAKQSQDVLKKSLLDKNLIVSGQITFVDNKYTIEEFWKLSDSERDEFTKIMFIMDKNTPFLTFELREPNE